jgi:U3 small nucleolar RNA-associated protein 15
VTFASSFLCSTITGENRYWTHFKNPVNTKHYNKITDIEFSPLEPYDFAVTSSTRVEIYDSMTCSKKKSLSRFPDIAYSGSYRGSDGKVLVAGCEDSKIRVYDLSSRVVLRTLVGHTAPVKAVRFLSEQRFLLSGSDDNSVRTWDMTTEQNLDVLRGHTDYVRTVSEHTEFSAFCFLSGAYDHAIRYWDRRLSNRGGQACVFVLDHGAPVEDFLVLPNHGQGDLLATAGENQVQVWSLKMASSSPATSQRARIHRASNHQKTTMTLAYDQSTDRMISGGLDHMVKIYDMRPSLTGGSTSPTFEGAAAAASSQPVSSFSTSFMQVTHSMKFSGPILCTAISPDSRVLVVGMADGSLSIRSRDTPGAAPGGIIAPKNLAESLREDVAYQTPLPPPKKALRTGTRAYFARGASYDPAKAGAEDEEAGEADFRIARVRRAKLAPYDQLLKSFRYHAALDAAVATNKAAIVVAMLDELINRNALIIALANRDAAGLLPLLHFTARYLPHPSYSSILLELVNLVLDLYSSLLGTVMEFDEIFYRLSRQVLSAEIETQKNCIAVQAFMDNISSRAELKVWEEDEDEEMNEGQEGVEEENRMDTDAQPSNSSGSQSSSDMVAPSSTAKLSAPSPKLSGKSAPSPRMKPQASPKLNGAQAKPSPKLNAKGAPSPKLGAQQATQQQKRKQPESSSSSSEDEGEDASEEEATVHQKSNGHAKPAAVTSSESDDDDASSEAEEEEEEEPEPIVQQPKKKSKHAPMPAAPATANGKGKKQKV